MHDGRVVQSGTPAELFDKPAHTFVGYFIGSPGMNIIPGRGEGAAIGADRRSRHRAQPAAMTTCRRAPRSRSVCVRNSSMPSRRHPGLPHGRKSERVDDLGRIRFARTRLGDAKLAARAPAGFTSSDGTAGLKFDPSHVHVYADSLLVEGAA